MRPLSAPHPRLPGFGAWAAAPAVLLAAVLATARGQYVPPPPPNPNQNAGPAAPWDPSEAGRREEGWRVYAGTMIKEEGDRQWAELWRDIRRVLPVVLGGAGAVLLLGVGRLCLRFMEKMDVARVAETTRLAQGRDPSDPPESHPSRGDRGNSPGSKAP
jgi:hypothetical protein